MKSRLVVSWPVVLQAGRTFHVANPPDPVVTGSTTSVYLAVGAGVATLIMVVLLVRWWRRGQVEGEKLAPEIQQKLDDALNREDFRTAGEMLEGEEQWERAADNFIKAGMPRRAGECFEQAGSLAEAAHYYKQGGEGSRAARLYRRLERPLEAAAEFVKLGKHRDAAACYEEAGEYDRAAYNYARAGDHREAGERYVRADEIEAAAEEYLRAAETMELEGVQRRELAAQAAKFFEEGDKFVRAGEAWERAERPDRAVEALTRAGEWERAAEVWVERGEVDRAIELLEDNGRIVAADAVRGERERELGNISRAADLFAQASHHQQAAELYEEAGEKADAAEHYARGEEWSRAFELYRELDNWEAAARCAEKAGALVEAASLYQKAGDVEGEIRVRASQGDYFRAGRLLYEEGRFDEALNALRRINARDPVYERGLELQGDVLRAKGDFEGAYKRYRKALGDDHLTRQTAPLVYKMGRTLEEAEEPEAAVAKYQKLLKLDEAFEDVRDRVEALQRGSTPDGQGEVESIPGPEGEDLEAPPDASEAEDVRYEYIEEIARGGMGIVYRARDTFLDRIVAVKVLGEDLRGNETAVEYFLREARAAAALTHPNIVTIFDAGEQNGEYYIAMEFVEGTTVKESVRADGAIDEFEVRRILKETAKALKYAHEQNIVHRDVKSGNIMRREDGAVKIMDFGLAKVIREYQREHTQQVGTPYYMSPEQIIGKDVDPRSDLYGLGCTAFECVTGEVPFSEGELAYHHRHTDPPKPTDVNPAVSAPMERFILTLMAKQPDERYQSAEQVIKVLDHMPETG